MDHSMTAWYLFQRKGEAVTFLNDSEKRNPDMSNLVCSSCGLDYVWHEDVLPYTSSEKIPISHNHFKDFFSQNENTGKCLSS